MSVMGGHLLIRMGDVFLDRRRIGSLLGQQGDTGMPQGVEDDLPLPVLALLDPCLV